MSHGGLPGRRVDQHESATPRQAVPGSRLQQIANNKTLPITAQIVNKPGNPVNVQIINEPGVPVAVQIINQPGTPVVVQDGGILNGESVQAVATDNQNIVLVSAAMNVNGLQLWRASMSGILVSSGVPTPVAVNDVIQDDNGI